jgi:two-component system C4-dicarboxylate transport sensor histidine kinase DctB
MRERRAERLLAAAALVLTCLIAAAGWMVFRDAALAAEHRQAQGTLRLTVRALDGYLERYRTLTEILAADRDLARMAQDGGGSGTELQARITAGLAITGALGIRILRADGGVVATAGAATAAAPDWLDRALQQGKATALHVDPASGNRELTIAARVAAAPDVVVAVRQNLDEIEAEWRRLADAVIVADAQGRILLSTRRDWRPGSVQAGQGLVASRAMTGGATILTLSRPAGNLWVEARQGMPDEDWTVRVWVDAAPYLAGARRSTGLVALSCALAVLGAALVWQRRARLAERIRLTEGARAQLERRVEARTTELAAVATRLEQEVQDRRATEAELRRTQADLIQSGKLAALGQMSAALSHEINQPLAAVRNFADSAGKYLDRGDTATARDNLGRILGMVDRMSAIARHLRDVARKPDRPLSDVALAPVVAEALLTADQRLRTAEATVTTDLPADLPLVRAGPLRLGQVIVNLLSNAADAVEGRDDRRIAVAARAEGGRVLLTVSDSGPGVADPIAHRIFDPFFTTKTVGAGLGLGLSISYNIARDFGGDLRIGTAPGGGAEFTLDLKRADAA